MKFVRIWVTAGRIWVKFGPRFRKWTTDLDTKSVHNLILKIMECSAHCFRRCVDVRLETLSSVRFQTVSTFHVRPSTTTFGVDVSSLRRSFQNQVMEAFGVQVSCPFSEISPKSRQNSTGGLPNSTKSMKIHQNSQLGDCGLVATTTATATTTIAAAQRRRPLRRWRW